MALSLAAIGTGLGMFAQDYMKKKAADAQIDLTRAKLQQDRQRMQAENLLGGLPGSTFQTGAGDLSSVGGGSMGQPASSGGLPAGGSAPPLATGGLNLPGSSFLPPAGAPPQMPAAAAPGPNTTANPMYQNGRYMPERDTGEGIGAAGDDMRIPLDPPQPSGQAGAAPGATTAPATAAQSGTATQGAPAAGAAAPSGGGQNLPITNPLMQRILGPTLDLGGVMDRIRKARPDADPGTVWRAATMMYEMVEKGNQQQMNNAIRALTQLRLQDQLGERVRHNVVTEDQGAVKTGIAQQRADTSSAAQADTAQNRQFQQGATTERLAQGRQRLQQQGQQLDRIRQAAEVRARQGDVNGARQILQAQIRPLISQLNPPLGSPPPDDATRAWLQQQIDDLQQRLQKLGGGAAAPARPAAPASP